MNLTVDLVNNPFIKSFSKTQNKIRIEDYSKNRIKIFFREIIPKDSTTFFEIRIINFFMSFLFLCFFFLACLITIMILPLNVVYHFIRFIHACKKINQVYVICFIFLSLAVHFICYKRKKCVF